MDDGARRVIGKVIKSDAPSEGAERSVGRGGRAILGAEEFEARTSAERIIAEARRTAQEIIDEAEGKARELIEAAEAQRAEVFERARLEAVEAVTAKATAELARAKMQAGQIMEQSEAALAALALEVAERIIGRDLERDPELIADICANAIESLRNSRALVLRVNPRDGALLREKKPRLMELVGRAVDIAIKDDPDVGPGGCIVQTEFGTIDGQLRTQFEMLKQAMLPDGKAPGPP